MYILDDDYNVARTKQQLQIISDKEIAPNNKYIRGKPDTYVIEKIKGVKKVGNKTKFLIKWKSYDNSQNSWIDSSELDRTKHLKQMKKDFKAQLQKAGITEDYL